MNRNEIIFLAQKAGIKGPAPARQGFKMYANPDRLSRFVDLILAAEREACAKECDIQASFGNPDERFGARQCAHAIRTRE